MTLPDGWEWYVETPKRTSEEIIAFNIDDGRAYWANEQTKESYIAQIRQGRSWTLAQVSRKCFVLRTRLAYTIHGYKNAPGGP